MSDTATSIPVAVAHGATYDYGHAIAMLRDADRIAARAADRIARIYTDHARSETLALCDRIVAACEVRAMQREALRTAYLPGDIIAIQSIMSK